MGVNSRKSTIRKLLRRSARSHARKRLRWQRVGRKLTLISPASRFILLLLVVALALACAHNKGIDKQAKALVLTLREQVSPALLAVPPAAAGGQVEDLGRPRVALVLGSGGTRGIAHIGVLRVLRRERIPIDFVVGSSVGSIVGALFCSGIPQDELEQIAITSKRADIFRYTISKSGVVDGARVEIGRAHV